MADDRGIDRIGVAAVAVLVLAIATVAIVLRGGGLGADVAFGGYDPDAVEARVSDALATVELRPSRAIRLTGRELVWNDGSGRPFLETPRATATVRFQDGGAVVVVADGVIEAPRLRLEQLGPERWNYETPLAPFLEDGDSGDDDAGLTVLLRDMSARDADVTIDMLEATYEVRDLDMRLSRGQLSGPDLAGPTFQVAEAEGELVLPDTAADAGVVTRAVRLADGAFELVDGELSFRIETARFGESRLASLDGIWNPELGGYGLDMGMRVVEGRVADLPWLPGEVPEGARGSLDVRLEPRPRDRTAIFLSDLDITAPGSSATGSVRFVFGADEAPELESIDVRVDPLSLDLAEAFTGPLPYGGAVSGTIRGPAGDIQVDLAGTLTAPAIAEPFDARLTGRLALGADGPRLRNASVGLDRIPLEALQPLVPGLPLRGAVSGSLDLEGAPDAGPMNVDLRLEVAGGIVTATGTADLSGAEPAYDLSGRAAGVDLRSLLVTVVPPLELNADFAIEGRGTDPRTAEARLSARGGLSGWQTEAGDTLLLQAAVQAGTATIQEARIEAGPIRIEAEGRWAFVDGTGELRYHIAAAEVEALSPYLPTGPEGRRRFAQGALELAGTAEGTLERPRLSGELSAEGFRWGEWAAESLTGSYSFALREGLPRLGADVEGVEIRTPATDFDRVDLTVDFGRPEFDFSFLADQEGDRGVVEIEAGGRIDETGRREILLRRLEVDLRRRRWRLNQPANIAWTEGEAVAVQGLELRQEEGEGRIALDGVLAPADDMDASLEVTGLPVGDLLELAGIDIELHGDLTATATVVGPALSPVLDVQLGLADGDFRGVRIRSLETEITYDTATLAIDGEGLLGDSAAIEIGGTLPARLRLEGSPIFALVDDAPIDLRILSRTFPLSTADPGLAMVEGLSGTLEANLRVGGTPAEPQLSGAASLEDGAFTVPVLNRRFHGMRGRVLLSGREANLERLVVESGGRAVLRGAMDFENLTNPTLDLEATLEEFRVQGLDGDEAALDGAITVGGTFSRPVVTGRVLADNGELSLAPFQQPELSSRLTDTRLQLADANAFDAPTGDGGVTIRNLRFIAGQDLRFTSREAEVPLAGTLTVNKSGESLSLQGTLSGEGGYFELRAGVITRNFQIASAEIRFFGSPQPNPRLDIVAARQVRTADGGTVEVEVRVGGTLESPSLSLASAAGPAIPESELLSFLLFGRSSNDLAQVAGGGSAEGFLGQSAAYLGLAEGLASQINEAADFLDYFQLDYLPAGGLFAIMGVELLNDVFLTAEWPVSAEADLSAIGVEWRAGFGSLRGAWEPVQRLDRLVGAQTLSFIDADRTRQVAFAWLRRWTY